jgi:hypothetical protein
MVVFLLLPLVLYTNFLLFFYFWKVAQSSFVIPSLALFLYPYVCALSSFYAFVHPSVPFLSSVHTFFFLHNFFLLHSFFLLFHFFILRFLSKITSKISCPIGPQHSLWLVPSHSGLFPILPLCNELLRNILSHFHLSNHGGLFFCDLLNGQCGQVLKFSLCVICDLFDLPLYIGQFTNNLDRFFLSGSKSLLKDLLLVPESLYFDTCLSLHQNGFHSLNRW